MKQIRKRKVRQWAAMIVLPLMILTGCQNQGEEQQLNTSPLEIHYIDVGQGHATLVMSNGQSLLMDGGNEDQSPHLVSYLKDCGVTRLDYIVVSAYDSEHLGGVVGAVNALHIDKVLSPGRKADTKIYNSFKTALKKKNITSTAPSVGDEYSLGDASFTVVAPKDYKYEEENNNSIAIRIVNGNNSFLITGDAEAQSESDMCESDMELKSDVYLAGNHGSINASSEKFLQTVQPSAVVISCGKDNNYGLPSPETVRRMKEMGATIYRTDQLGTIIATSDGNKITWKKENGESIGSAQTKAARNTSVTIGKFPCNFSQLTI